MSTLVGVRAALEPEAHRLRPDGLSLRSTLPRSKNVLHDLNKFNLDFLSSKRCSIKGRGFRKAVNESVADRGPLSPSCSGRLKKNSGDWPSTRNKIETVRFCACAPLGSLLDEQTMSISIAESDSKRFERFELLERIELCRRPPLLPNHCTPRRSRIFLT